MNARSTMLPLRAIFPRPRGALQTICEDREYHAVLDTSATTIPSSVAHAGISPEGSSRYLTHQSDRPSRGGHLPSQQRRRSYRYNAVDQTQDGDPRARRFHSPQLQARPRGAQDASGTSSLRFTDHGSVVSRLGATLSLGTHTSGPSSGVLSLSNGLRSPRHDAAGYLSQDPRAPSPRSDPLLLEGQTQGHDAAAAFPLSPLEQCGVASPSAMFAPERMHSAARDALADLAHAPRTTSPLSNTPSLEFQSPQLDAAVASPSPRGHVEYRNVVSPGAPSPLYDQPVVAPAHNPPALARRYATPQHGVSRPQIGVSSHPPQPARGPATYTGSQCMPAVYSPLTRTFSKTVQVFSSASPVPPLRGEPPAPAAEHDDSTRDRRGIVRRARESSVTETPSKKQRYRAANDSTGGTGVPDWCTNSVVDTRRGAAQRHSCLSPVALPGERDEWHGHLSMMTPFTPPPPCGGFITPPCSTSRKFESPISVHSNSPLQVRADSPSAVGDAFETPPRASPCSDTRRSARPHVPPLSSGALKTPTSPSVDSDAPTRADSSSPRLLSPVGMQINRNVLAKMLRIYGDDGYPKAPRKRRTQRPAPSAPVSRVERDDFDDDDWRHLYN